MHKRSISGINSNISNLIKVNRNTVIKDKTQRTSLTPTRNTGSQSTNNLPKTGNVASSRVEFKSSELNYDTHKINKFPIASDRINKSSLVKSIINMPITTIKNMSDNMVKKIVTSRPNTSGTSNLLKTYREEKLRPRILEKENSFEHNEIKVRKNSKSPKVSTGRKSLSKSPLKEKNPPTITESLLKRYEELKKRSVSPLTIGQNNRGVIKIGESKINNIIKSNERDNKFTGAPDFREMNTSPLVIRVIFFYFRGKLMRNLIQIVLVVFPLMLLLLLSII